MIVRICVLVVVLLVSACARKPPAEVADLVILDAGIVTMNSAQPDASALAVRSGKIAYVGDDAGAQGWIGKSTRVLRLKGVTVLPGLIDTHIHLMDGALALDYCTLGDQTATSRSRSRRLFASAPRALQVRAGSSCTASE